MVGRWVWSFSCSNGAFKGAKYEFRHFLLLSSIYNLSKTASSLLTHPQSLRFLLYLLFISIEIETVSSVSRIFFSSVEVLLVFDRSLRMAIHWRRGVVARFVEWRAWEWYIVYMATESVPIRNHSHELFILNIVRILEFVVPFHSDPFRPCAPRLRPDQATESGGWWCTFQLNSSA